MTACKYYWPILEWTKYARLVLHVTLYDTGRSSFPGPYKKNWGYKLRVYPLLQAPLHHCLYIYVYIYICIFTFTFMHLADAFIQSVLQCIQVIHFFVSTCVPWESNPQPLRCQRNALTTEPQELRYRNRNRYIYIYIYVCMHINTYLHTCIRPFKI